MDEVVMDVAETASFLKCSKQWLYREVQNKTGIPFHKLGGKTVFFKCELIEWLRKK